MGLANKTTAGDQLMSRLLAVWHLVFSRCLHIDLVSFPVAWYALVPGGCCSAEELYREPHDDWEEYPPGGGRTWCWWSVTRTTSVIKAAQVGIIATSRWWGVRDRVSVEAGYCC